MSDRIEELEARVAELEKHLSFDRRQQQVVTLTELQAMFGYQSKQAMMLHIQNGRFPIPLTKIVHDLPPKPGQRKPGKRCTWVASAEVVRRYFEDVHRAQLEIYEKEFRQGVLGSGTL